MRILIITEFFPPKNTIGSLRLYSFAKYWQKAGHDITVLTTVKPPKNTDLNFNMDAFTIIAIPIPFVSRLSLSNPKLDSSLKDKKKSVLGILVKIFIAIRLKTGCFITHFPNFTDLWSIKAFGFVNADNYDLVLSSGGPYSVHRVGLKLKKQNSKIKWIVDWRDPWTMDPNTKGLFIFRQYERYLENKFHNNADLITTVSIPYTNAIKSITNKTVKTIYNGFEPEDFTKIMKSERETGELYKIVYTGSLYRNLQDPSPLFEALSKIRDKDISLFNRIKVIFAGLTCDVSDIARKFNISAIYSYLGFIKREESLKLQYDASAVLFIDSNAPEGQLFAKIYEYIYISKKIIAIGKNPDSASIELIKNTNTGIFLGNNIDLISDHLIKCLTNKDDNVYKKNFSFINEFTRENQANKLLEELKC